MARTLATWMATWMALVMGARAAGTPAGPGGLPPAVAGAVADRFPGWTVESAAPDGHPEGGWALRLSAGDRWIEAEVDARGRVGEVRALLSPDLLPPDVRAAVHDARPAGRIVAAEAEREGGSLVYEVLVREDGNLVEATVRAGGPLPLEEDASPDDEDRPTDRPAPDDGDAHRRNRHDGRGDDTDR